MSKLSELYGSMVFNDSVMQEKLPHDIAARYYSGL